MRARSERGVALVHAVEGIEGGGMGEGLSLLHHAEADGDGHCQLNAQDAVHLDDELLAPYLVEMCNWTRQLGLAASNRLLLDVGERLEAVDLAAHAAEGQVDSEEGKIAQEDEPHHDGHGGRIRTRVGV